MSVLTAQGISSLAVTLLARQLVLPATVSKVPGTEFTGANGDTITVRVRQPRSSRVQATPGAAISYDALDEVAVNLTVQHLYSATLITDEQATLELQDFGAQVLAPLTAAVAIGAENQIVTVMNALTNHSTIKFAKTMSDADTIKQVLALREELTLNDCPLGDRWLACSPSVITRLLSLEQLVGTAAADSRSSLRDATVGRLYGFNVVESAGLTAGTAVAYHSSGFVWGNRAPANPQGASSSTTATTNGVALRTVADFDPGHLSDALAVSTFAGAAAVYENTSGTDNARFVKTHISAT